jgi:hypothetical protein
MDLGRPIGEAVHCETLPVDSERLRRRLGAHSPSHVLMAYS